MSRDSTNDNAKIINARLVQWLQRDLASEQDELKAIRKALLGLMFTIQPESPAYRDFLNYILSEFPPIADHFIEDLHPFIEGFEIRRWEGEEGSELLLHKSFHESMMSEPLSTDDIFSAGLRWPWELTDQRFVGFFDIMGFKAFIERNADEHEHIHRLLRELRESAASSEEIGFSSKDTEGPLNYPGCWLRFIQFSDSIVLITRDASPKSSAIIALAAQLLFHRAMGLGIGMRGAIAQGTFTADFEQSIFFGQPLIDAYLLEEKQAWYGVAYHASADTGGFVDGQEIEPQEIVPETWIPVNEHYLVPVKGGEPPQEYAVVNWPMMFRDDPKGLDAFIDHLRFENEPKLMKYYTATRDFGHEMLRRLSLIPKR